MLFNFLLRARWIVCLVDVGPKNLIFNQFNFKITQGEMRKKRRTSNWISLDSDHVQKSVIAQHEE